MQDSKGKRSHAEYSTPRIVLVIGTDTGVLSEGSEHRSRMLRYATTVAELHVLVLGGRTALGFKTKVGDNLYLYSTRAQSRAWSLIEGYRLAKRIVQNVPVDIISTQDPFETALLGYLVRGVNKSKLNIQEHGDFFSHPYWRRERILHQVRYILGSWLLRHADCFRVVSMRIARELMRRGVARETIAEAPLYTSVAACGAAVPNPDIAALRPANGVLILTMARFVPQKNLTMLIRAFGASRSCGVPAKLVIVGKGPGAAMLRTVAREIAPGDVVFLDWTQDAMGAMKAADIYALSSNYEGWGRVAIEALAAGTPLVMTDVGCAGEIVRDGENGLVVPVNHEQAFAAALMRLCTDRELRAALALAGRKTAAALPTEEESLYQFEKSLQCCMLPQV